MIPARPSDDLNRRIQSLGSLPGYATKLEPTLDIHGIFAQQPDKDDVHVIVRVEAVGE
jgi:hypothetical protein